MTPALRLSSDSSQARRDMQEFGRTAQRELDATKGSARGLSQEVGTLQGNLQGAGGAAGELAGTLSKVSLIAGLMGSRVTAPLIGAAAGATTLALVFAQINAETAQLGRNIDASGLSPELFQAIERRAVRTGVEIKDVHGALFTARQRFYEAERGAGSFYAQLRAAAPDVLDAVNAQDTHTRKLEVFLKALDQYPNKMDRATLAQAAFGEQGDRIVRMLNSQEGGLQSLQREYQAAGGLLTAETIRMAQETERAWLDMIRSVSSEWDQFKARVKEKFLRGVDLVSTSPEEEIQNSLRKASDMLNLRGSSLDALEADLARVRAGEESKVRIFQEGLSRARSMTESELQAMIGREKARLDEAKEAYRTAMADLMAFQDANRISVLFGPEDPESRLQSALTTAAERAALESEAAQLLIQQNDIVGAYEIGQRRLNKLKEEGLITDVQKGRAETALSEALARQTPAYQARLEAEREALRRAQEYRRLQGEAAQVLVQQNDITLALKFEEERINRLKANGLLTAEQAAAEYERAKQALIAMTPEFKASAEFQTQLAGYADFFARKIKDAADEAERLAKAERDARNAAASRILDSVETPLQRKLRELAELEDLMASAARGETDVVIGEDAAARRIAQIEEYYQRASEEASQFRDTQYEIEDVLWSLTDPAISFEQAWRRALRTFVEEFLGIEEMIRGFGRTFREFVEGVAGGRTLGGMFGGLFGVGAASAAVSAPVVNSSAGGPWVPEFHEGGRIGQPKRWRDLSRGVAPHESLIVARNDEVIGYPGGGGGSFTANFYAPGADATAVAMLQREVEVLRTAFLGAQRSFRPSVEAALAAIAAEKGRLT